MQNFNYSPYQKPMYEIKPSLGGGSYILSRINSFGVWQYEFEGTFTQCETRMKELIKAEQDFKRAFQTQEKNTLRYDEDGNYVFGNGTVVRT